RVSPASRTTRRADTAPPARKRPRLYVGRRVAPAVASMAASLHVLRLRAVLRVDVGGGLLSRVPGIGGTVRGDESAGGVGSTGRRGPADRSGWPGARAPQAGSGSQRPGAARSRQVVHRAAVLDQPHGSRAARLA